MEGAIPAEHGPRMMEGADQDSRVRTASRRWGVPVPWAPRLRGFVHGLQPLPIGDILADRRSAGYRRGWSMQCRFYGKARWRQLLKESRLGWIWTSIPT